MRALSAVLCVAAILGTASAAQAQEQARAPAADANATYVLPLRAAHERPAHRLAFSIGGSYPPAATVQGHAIFGLAPISAARLSVVGIYHTHEVEGVKRHAVQPMVLLGPTAIFDMVRYVPHVFVQGGIAILPIAPVIAFGASIEQFFTLRTSAVATLQGVWQQGFGLRVEAQMGVSFAGT